MKHLLFKLAILLCLISLGSCRSDVQNQFELSVQTIGFPATTLILEELDIDKVFLIDSLKTDDNGFAILKGKYGKPNLYRLTIKDKGQVYLVLDQNKIDIKIDSTDVFNYTVEGSPRSSQLKSFVKQIFEFNKQIAEATFSSKFTKIDNDSLAQNSDVTVDLKIKMNQFVKLNADTVTSLPLALFFANFLPMEKEAKYLNQFLNKIYQRFPDQTLDINSYQKLFFNNYNLFVNEQKIQMDSLSQGMHIGKPAPVLKAYDIDGTEISSNQYKDKYLVVQFVGSWNENSRYWNKQLTSLQKELPNYPIQIMSIYVEQDKAQFIKAVEEDNLPWPQLSTFKSWHCPNLTSLDVVTIPTTIVINPESTIVGIDWSLAQLKEELKAMAKPIEPKVDSLTTKQHLVK